MQNKLTKNILVEVQRPLKILAQDSNMVKTNNSDIFNNTTFFCQDDIYGELEWKYKGCMGNILNVSILSFHKPNAYMFMCMF